jgi:type II secretory ATPase GspE/PulE/Tfp pilus assembly ATPase PilB-like protein
MGNGGLSKIDHTIFSREEKIKNNIQEDPVVVLADEVLWQAINIGASDIHFQPTEIQLRIRYRIDGMLHDQEPVPIEIGLAVVSRLKILSCLDIAEKRLPQDGKFHANFVKSNAGGEQKIIDFRVSTFPSTNGEKMVVRLLDRSVQLLTINSLGLHKSVAKQVLETIQRPHGLFLVTGPTGSGKTTTLYAMLSHLNKPGLNIITMEDPVEYNLQGVTQSQVNPKADFTFENGLRSILRQDPDIIMIGEIRDKATMQIAIEAALTGHLVFSTLHTNDAAGAITRLIEMGAEPFLINASLIGILAQRLVRKLCKSCKDNSSNKNNRCDDCLNSGYRGRIGIFEFLPFNESYHELVLKNASANVLQKHAETNGMLTLFDDGKQKVSNGLTSMEELLATVIISKN